MSTASAALALVRALPARPASAIAQLAVVLHLWLRPDYRREIEDNYRVVMGSGRPGFWFSNARRVGRNLALMAHSDKRTGKRFVDTAVVRWENHTGQSLERELHSVMASFHFGTWEYLPQVFAHRGFAVRLAVGRQRDAALQRRLEDLRERSGVRLVRSLREVVSALAEPGLTGFMLDNTSQGNQRWAVIDQVALRMPVLPFRVAAETGARVVPAFAGIDSRGRLVVDIGEPGDEQVVARALLARVRQHPEEWVWWGKAGAVRRADGRGEGMKG
jgi:lauroyl/myristoyl acyltransferase